MLQHVAVPVIENHVCESWHRRKGIDIRIYDEMMCAGYELGQRDACQVNNDDFLSTQFAEHDAEHKEWANKLSSYNLLNGAANRAIPEDRSC